MPFLAYSILPTTFAAANCALEMLADGGVDVVAIDSTDADEVNQALHGATWVRIRNFSVFLQGLCHRTRRLAASWFSSRVAVRRAGVTQTWSPGKASRQT